MKNRELKRLNLVLHNGKIKTIDCVAPGQVILLEDRKTEESFGGWVDLDEVEFIPLTEEWLIKFGFEISDDSYSDISGEKKSTYQEVFIGDNPITKDYLLILKNIGNGWFYRNGYFKIESVHDLQNLYFALTKQELIISN